MTRSRPVWLKRLGMGCRDHATDDRPPTERFRAACELMEFAHGSLRRQAEERGVTVTELLMSYERAQARFARRVT